MLWRPSKDSSGECERTVTRKTMIERVFAKCRVSDSGCVEWTGAKSGDTSWYGIVWMDGKLVKVHRAVYEHFVGPIGHGFELDHLCRNKTCCRIDHLEPVTRVVNTRRGVGWVEVGGVWVCKRGHAMEGRNVVVRPNQVMCRACSNMMQSARRSEGKV